MTVGTSSSSFDDLFASFDKAFDNTVPAAALLWWWTSSQFGVRVEVPSLGKEFSNGMNLGRDPEGFLFFNDIGDLEDDVSYDVYYNTVTDSTQRAFVIEFYTKGNTSAKSFAKFLAKDPNKTVTYTIDTSTGTWSDVTTSESTGRIKKGSTDDTWTLTVPSIHKKVTFKDNGTTTTSFHKRVDTLGQLIWKDINKISNGVYVDYRDDRIVFTETNEWSKDFCAFFLPLVTSEVPNPLGPYVVAATKATWSAA
jgi:hypothetical protein